MHRWQFNPGFELSTIHITTPVVLTDARTKSILFFGLSSFEWNMDYSVQSFFHGLRVFSISAREILPVKQHFNAPAPIVRIVDDGRGSNALASSSHAFERGDYRFDVQQIALIGSVNSHHTPYLLVLLNARVAVIPVRA
jgi:hypothetical protein